jgi:hypothetical protein
MVVLGDKLVVTLVQALTKQFRLWLTGIQSKITKTVETISPTVINYEPVSASNITLFPLAASATVAVAAVTAARSLRGYLFAARLRSVAVLNLRKDRKQSEYSSKSHKNRKAKPAGAQVTHAKRTPALFATKVKPATSKRATNRILFAANVRPTAQIIKFPTKMPVLAVPRLRRVA